MADQYTRITCGGSPLDKTAPVVGLLFGNTSELDGTLQIMDADDIPTETTEASMIQVNLHRAVFPQHTVVGWYRVSLDDEPSPNDLQITQQLKSHYSNLTTNPDGTGEKDANASSDQFIFCLLQVQRKETSTTEPTNTLSTDLPITLYEVHTVDNSSILLGLNNWQLETSEPERISVERVMREQPQHHAPTKAGPSTNALASTSKKPAGGSSSSASATYSPYVTRVQSVQHSLQSMKDRIQLLIKFLEDTQQGHIPPNFSLMRQVQGLIYTLGPLAAVAPNKASSGDGIIEQDALFLSHLAAVAKTVSAVQSYTDKFRLVHENRVTAKEMRRAY